MELLHNILSHQGQYAWGSPRRPKTLEALILHAVENLDGKVNLFLKLAKRHHDPHREGWTIIQRSFERPLFFGEADSSKGSTRGDTGGAMSTP
jgi:3'-5' exoribonuclease